MQENPSSIKLPVWMEAAVRDLACKNKRSMSDEIEFLIEEAIRNAMPEAYAQREAGVETLKAANPDCMQICMTKPRVIYCCLSFLCLGMGMCIYLFFRDLSGISLFAWLPWLSLPDFPHVPFDTGSALGYLFVFNLPHGLWCLSGLLAIRAIWLASAKWRAVYGGIFLAVISALEISQLSENRHGTFDVLDLASYGVAAFVESMTYNKFIRRRVL